MIATGREREGGEKVNLKTCLAGELNPVSSVKGESTDHYTKGDC